MNQPLKVAVTGLGFSSKYLRNYLDAPETELVLLHDIYGQHARAPAAELGECGWTTDFDEVFCSKVDIAEVATPNNFHADQVLAAMEAGKHVLCQKPMAPAVAECRRTVDASQRTGMVLGMNITWISNILAFRHRVYGQPLLRGRPAGRGPGQRHRRAVQRGLADHGGGLLQHRTGNFVPAFRTDFRRSACHGADPAPIRRLHARRMAASPRTNRTWTYFASPACSPRALATPCPYASSAFRQLPMWRILISLGASPIARAVFSKRTCCCSLLISRKRSPACE